VTLGTVFRGPPEAINDLFPAGTASRSLHLASASSANVVGLECSPILRPRIMAGFPGPRRILHAEEPVHG
jgi:hypothetical protein